MVENQPKTDIVELSPSSMFKEAAARFGSDHFVVGQCYPPDLTDIFGSTVNSQDFDSSVKNAIQTNVNYGNISNGVVAGIYGPDGGMIIDWCGNRMYLDNDYHFDLLEDGSIKESTSPFDFRTLRVQDPRAYTIVADKMQNISGRPGWLRVETSSSELFPNRPDTSDTPRIAEFEIVDGSITSLTSEKYKDKEENITRVYRFHSITPTPDQLETWHAISKIHRRRKLPTLAKLLLQQATRGIPKRFPRK